MGVALNTHKKDIIVIQLVQRRRGCLADAHLCLQQHSKARSSAAQLPRWQRCPSSVNSASWRPDSVIVTFQASSILAPLSSEWLQTEPHPSVPEFGKTRFGGTQKERCLTVPSGVGSLSRTRDAPSQNDCPISTTRKHSRVAANHCSLEEERCRPRSDVLKGS